MYEELAYKDGRLLINLILLRCMRLHQSSNGAVCHQRAFCALPAEMPGLHAVTVGPLQNGEKDRRVWLFGQRPVLFVLGNTDQFISRFPCSMPLSFSGFYLPLNIVLWLLVLRGIGIEFRMHIENQVWRSDTISMRITSACRWATPR